MPHKVKQAEGDLKHSSTVRVRSWTLLRTFPPHELLVSVLLFCVTSIVMNRSNRCCVVLSENTDRHT